MHVHGPHRRGAPVLAAAVVLLAGVAAGCSKPMRDDVVTRVVAEGLERKVAECYVDAMVAAGISIEKVSFDESTMKANGYTDAQGEMAESLAKGCLLVGTAGSVK